jgi:hypothetical protein
MGKVHITAISPSFSDDGKCVEMLYIYAIEKCGLYGIKGGQKL